MPWIIIFLLMVPLYGQTIATTEDGQKVMLFQDGTWRTMGEASLSTAEVGGYENLVYVEVISKVVDKPGLYGNYTEEWKPSVTEISQVLRANGIQTTRKESASRFTLLMEFDMWSIIDSSGRIVYAPKKISISTTRNVKDAAIILKQLM